MNRYLIIVEKANGNYSAYSPDVPGCVATGETREKAEQEMRTALRMHIDGIREDGLPVPQPSASVSYLDA